MKHTITLTSRGKARLEELVVQTGTNKSLVLELALDQLYETMPPAERGRLALGMLDDRRPRTRNGFRKLFWEMLADAMDAEDFGRGADRYLMAPRTYCGFMVLHDASHDLGRGNDNEVTVFVDTAPPYTPDTVRLGESWTFRLGEHRVSEAAQRVATWLRENEPRLRRHAAQ